MSNFKPFAEAVSKQAKSLTSTGETLFRVNLSKDQLKKAYLDGFPAGSNNLYLERTEHDCSTCNQFIGNIGNLVRVDRNGDFETVWDINTHGVDQIYITVAKYMSNLVKSRMIESLFVVSEERYGKAETIQTLDTKQSDNKMQVSTIIWNHFELEVPNDYVAQNSSELIGKYESTKHVFSRALQEISIDSIDTVLELIEENQLYRGDSVKDKVLDLKNHKRTYMELDDDKKDAYVWVNTGKAKNPNIRNSSIGQLLVNLSDEITTMEVAVNKYEAMVAGPNYKRPKAIVTKAMAQSLLKFIEDEGLEPSLYRRHATIGDVAITDVLFADRTSSRLMKGSLSDIVLSDLPQKVSVNGEVSVTEFMEMLPSIKKMEMKLENKHIENLVSITAPQNPDSKHLFGWDNNFAWSYNGNMTDTNIAKRVKSAGGKIDGYCRVSLGWWNKDDLDIHIIEPDGNVIHFGNKRSYKTGGRLDVDMNVRSCEAVEDAVENIYWDERNKLPDGSYKVRVHNYAKRTTSNKGFQIEFKIGDIMKTFSYPLDVKDGEYVNVFQFQLKDGELDSIFIESNIDSEEKSSDVWGIKTQNWVNVSTMMLSPNHWGDNASGNKHYMFMLDDCRNPDKARGFYNEYLKHNSREHRKAFEYFGEKLMCEYADNQLSGLGFSSTQRKDICCKVTLTDDTIRTLKINF